MYKSRWIRTLYSKSPVEQTVNSEGQSEKEVICGENKNKDHGKQK